MSMKQICLFPVEIFTAVNLITHLNLLATFTTQTKVPSVLKSVLYNTSDFIDVMTTVQW